ncbi:hypothetical protein MMC14_006836 [Varicellaria rhodocarpa]|nr:hypothetical protein [Varicellaria rhodocarpa]
MSSSRPRRLNPSKTTSSKPSKKIEDALPIVADPILDPTITEKLGKDPSLTLYLKFVLHSMKKINGKPTADIVRYLNTMPRVKKIGIVVERGHSKALLASLNKAPEEPKHIEYIWNHKCCEDYRFAIFDGVENRLSINLPKPEDKLVEGWLEDKSIRERDVKLQIKFILHSIIGLPGVTTGGIVRYFNRVPRLKGFLSPLTLQRAQDLYNQIVAESDETLKQ